MRREAPTPTFPRKRGREKKGEEEGKYRRSRGREGKTRAMPTIAAFTTRTHP
jgi:hypothetical protein